MSKKTQSKPRLSVPQFLYKTYELVENQETQDICSWSQQGDSFIIKNITQFCEKVLTSYFKSNNLASFVRQLNMYGFHKIRNEHNQSEFQHKYFKRGQKHLLTEIKRKSPNDNQKELLESQSETNNLTIQDIKKQDDENYDILAQNKSENYLNNQGFNLLGINQTFQPQNQIGLNGFNNSSLQNIGSSSTNNNLGQTISSQLFGQNINKQNDSNQTQDFLFLLKKQKEQESQIETLQSLTFRQNRENDLLKKKLLELEKAMGIVLGQHNYIINENQQIKDDQQQLKAFKFRVEYDKKIEKLVINLTQLIHSSNKQLYAQQSPMSFTDKEIKCQNETNDNEQNSKLGLNKKFSQEIEQPQNNKEDRSCVTHIEKNGEKIPLCSIKKKKKDNEQSVNDTIQTILKDIQNSKEIDQDQKFNLQKFKIQNNFPIPAPKCDMDNLTSLLQKRNMSSTQSLNGFQETKKKTCLDRDEQNQFNQKTPNSNYGGTSIFNNLNNLSPNHFYSPIYDTNSSQFINYLYQQGGTSPLPYFQGSSQLQNQNLSPKHQRTEPDNFNQNNERIDKN